jgi:hypothetical protein
MNLYIIGSCILFACLTPHIRIASLAASWEEDVAANHPEICTLVRSYGRGIDGFCRWIGGSAECCDVDPLPWKTKLSGVPCGRKRSEPAAGRRRVDGWWSAAHVSGGGASAFHGMLWRKCTAALRLAAWILGRPGGISPFIPSFVFASSESVSRWAAPLTGKQLHRSARAKRSSKTTHCCPW